MDCPEIIRSASYEINQAKDFPVRAIKPNGGIEV